jgi:hypothetical protein
MAAITAERVALRLVPIGSVVYPPERNWRSEYLLAALAPNGPRCLTMEPTQTMDVRTDLFSLIETLIDDERPPTYTSSKVLAKLDGLAKLAFERDTFDGCLSCVLISHQICEDFVLLLLRHAQLTLRLHVAPSGFGWPLEKYEQPGVREKATFGRVLELLDDSIEFEHKREFISVCRRQNEIRNRLAHKLLDVTEMTLSQIRDLAQEYARGTSDVIIHFNEPDEQFSDYYFEQRLELRWDEIIGKQVLQAQTPSEQQRWVNLRTRFRDSFVKTWKLTSDPWQERNPLPSWDLRAEDGDTAR